MDGEGSSKLSFDQFYHRQSAIGGTYYRSSENINTVRFKLPDSFPGHPLTLSVPRIM